MDTQTSDTEASSPVAGRFPNKRVCAFLIDIFFVFFFSLFFLEDLSYRMLEKGLVPATLIFEGLYLLLRDGLFRGRSLGKFVVGIQVMDLNGRPCGLWRSIVRNLIFVLPGAVTYAIFSDLIWLLIRKLLVVFYLIEYLALRFSSGGRRFGDRWAGTQVIDTRPHLKDSLFLWISLALFFGVPASRFVALRQHTNSVATALNEYKKTHGAYPKGLEELKFKPDPLLIYTSYLSRRGSSEFYLTGINAPFHNLSYNSERNEWRFHKGGAAWTKEEMGIRDIPAQTVTEEKPRGQEAPQDLSGGVQSGVRVNARLKNGESISGRIISEDGKGFWLEIAEGARVYFTKDEIASLTQG